MENFENSLAFKRPTKEISLEYRKLALSKINSSKIKEFYAKF